MDIYFLRHANAGEPKLNPSKDDERPLDKLGTEQSRDVGRALAALDATIDEIISSPLPRAEQTASLVAEQMGHKEKIVIDEALRPDASYEQFQELLRRHGDKDAIMVVGHNPSLTEFINKLLGGSDASSALDLKKGSIARVEKDGRKPAILKWYMTPKVVRAIQQASASSSRPKAVSK